MSTATEPARGSHEARVMHYDSIRRRHERRIRQALDDIRESLERTERRINSTDTLDRRLAGDSALGLARQAAGLVESASAWVALDEVSYFAEPVPSDTRKQQ